MLVVIKYLLLGMLILTLLILTYKLIYFRTRTKECYIGKHHCNDCKCSFFLGKDDILYEYCPFCGQELDYHYKDERSKSYSLDNDDEEL